MNLLKIAVSAALATGIMGSAVSAQSVNAASRANAAQAKATVASNYKPQTQRGQAASQIVSKWAGYVRTVYGTAPSVWSKAMQATFAQADVRNLQRAAKMTTFEGMMSALMGQRASDDQIIDKLARSDGSLAVIQALGSPSEDLVYTAVVPCRIIDTRLTGGMIAENETRHYNSSGADFIAQGGAATDCGVPAAAAVVVLNVVSVRPTAPGFLTIFPHGADRPLASSLNFVVGADVSNEVLVKRTMGQPYGFSIFSRRPSHVVADVAGYFAAPVATAVECETVNGAAITVPSSVDFSVTATCAAGFVATGGGNRVTGTGKVTVVQSYPSSTTSWTVTGLNVGGATASIYAVAQCCRVPGR